jgi:hypothetical protein
MWFTIVLSTLEGLAYITLAALYCIALASFNKIDKDMLLYAKDNKCSDAVLQRSIDVYSTSFSYEKKLASAGLFFVLFSFISYALIVLCMGIKSWKAMYHKTYEEPTKLEKQMSAMHGYFANYLKKNEKGNV